MVVGVGAKGKPRASQGQAKCKPMERASQRAKPGSCHRCSKYDKPYVQLEAPPRPQPAASEICFANAPPKFILPSWGAHKCGTPSASSCELDLLTAPPTSDDAEWGRPMTTVTEPKKDGHGKQSVWTTIGYDHDGKSAASPSRGVAVLRRCRGQRKASGLA